MIEKWLNRIVGWLFMVLFSLLAACTVKFELVTVPDPATKAWISDTSAFDSAVKKTVEDHEKRLRTLEQKEDNDT